MAYKLPEIKRIAPQEAASVGQIETRLPDATKNMARTSAIVEQGLETAVKYAEKAESDAADSVSDQAGVEFAVWRKTELSKLKQTKSEGTQAYSDFDERSRTMQAEIAGKYKGSSLTSERVNAKIQKAMWDTEDERRVDEGMVRENFNAKVYETGIQVKQDSALKASRLIDESAIAKGDTSSLTALGSAIQGIKDDSYARLAKQGLSVYIDKQNEDGTVTRTMRPPEDPIFQAANQEAKTKVGPAVQAVVESLTRNGSTEAAKKVLEQYKDDLPLKTVVDLETRNSDKFQDKEASNVAAEIARTTKKVNGKVIQLSAVEQLERADNLLRDKPEVAEKVKQKLDDNRRRYENAKETEAKTTFNSVASAVYDNSRSTKPGVEAYVSVADLRAKNPEVALNYDRMNVKQKEAIEKMINKPSESEPQALDRYHNIVGTPGGFAGMDKDEFRIGARGLNASMYKRAEAKFESDNNETTAELSKRDTFMMKELQSKLVGYGIVKKQDARAMSTKELEKLNGYRDELSDLMLTMPKNGNPELWRTAVNKYVNAVKLDKVKEDLNGDGKPDFTFSDLRPKFKGGTAKLPGDENQKESEEPFDLKSVTVEYVRKNQKTPQSIDQLKAWWKQQGKAK